jgi:hypothetical protein
MKAVSRSSRTLAAAWMAAALSAACGAEPDGGTPETSPPPSSAPERRSTAASIRVLDPPEVVGCRASLAFDVVSPRPIHFIAAYGSGIGHMRLALFGLTKDGSEVRIPWEPVAIEPGEPPAFEVARALTGLDTLEERHLVLRIEIEDVEQRPAVRLYQGTKDEVLSHNQVDIPLPACRAPDPAPPGL